MSRRSGPARPHAQGDGPSIAAGLAAGVLGTLYILWSHRDAPPHLLYHVPLAMVFGAYAWSIAFDVPTTTRRVRVPITLLAAIPVLGRVIMDWPISGHGLLGGLMAVLAPRPWQRILAGAVVVQSYVTKVIQDTGAHAVVVGALAGAAAGLLALAAERRLGGPVRA